MYILRISVKQTQGLPNCFFAEALIGTQSQTVRSTLTNTKETAVADLSDNLELLGFSKDDILKHIVEDVKL